MKHMHSQHDVTGIFCIVERCCIYGYKRMAHILYFFEEYKLVKAAFSMQQDPLPLKNKKKYYFLPVAKVGGKSSSFRKLQSHLLIRN